MEKRQLKFRAWDKKLKKMITKFSLMPTTPNWSPFQIIEPNPRLMGALRQYDQNCGDIAWGDYSLTDWSDWHGIEYFEVMQFTGCYDNTKWDELTEDEQLEWLEHSTIEEWKGYEIYEGDILQWSTWDGYGGVSVVEFKNGKFYPVASGCMEYQRFDESRGFKRIGNIYENPEDYV